MAEQKLEVLLYGLGAIGTFYAFVFSRCDNVRLTVVARSNYDAVKANGIKFTSENHGEHHFRPDNVVKTVADAGIKFDFILCAHKAIDQSTAVEQLAPGVDEKRTTIVIFQNGVGNEEPFRNRFPATTIISCVVWVGAIQPEPGVVFHTKSENTHVGLFPNDKGDAKIEAQRLEEFASLMKASGTNYEIFPDIQVQRWEKVVWNVAWNALTTLTLLNTHEWLSSSDDAIPMTRRLMGQVIDVAKALNVPLNHDLIDTLLDRILGMPSITTSMKTDFEQGRTMEVDMILGYPVKKGRELGINVETVDTIYVLLNAINKRLSTKEKL